ncbi:MAG: glycoside hydrolase family 5 protein [Bacteroidales bacterium]|nr:glycoside hydrolase family 5 protein [Bacteroidales bacterium]MBN2817427.1 glycoside hydrolase family 5 protein [Bacteroidales bacterium]
MRFIYIFGLFLIVSSMQITGQVVSENGQLQVDGLYLKNAQGDTIVLRGMSLGWHNWWPQYYTPETVKWLKEDWKCSIVRAPMGVDPDSGYIKMKEWSVNTISTVVDAAIENDIYVIIDWHSHSLKTKQAVEFFSAMAKKYGSYPNVIYEIFNEPINNSWEEVKKYSIKVIEAIREHDPDNIILVGNPHWCQDIHLVADDPIEGYDNIMYTVHFYAATHKDFLRERSDYALSKGIPVFVSEYGACHANGDDEIDYEEWQKWLDWMDANAISWCKWSIVDKVETSAALKPKTPTSGWTEDDLSESGKASRKLLRKYAGLKD